MIGPDGQDWPYDFSDDEAWERPYEPRRGLVSRLRAKNVDLLVYLLLMLVGAYWAALHFLYKIVGG